MNTINLVIVYSLQLLMVSKPAMTSQEYLEALSDYSTYKLIEDALAQDPEQLFKMRDAFFSTKNDRYWQVDGVKVVSIYICVSLANSTSVLQCEGEANVLGETRKCWSFHWTNSRLLNLISGELLLAMDVVTTKYIYPGIVGNASLQLDLKINMNATTPECLLVSDRMEKAVTSFLSWAKLYAMENSPTPTKWDSSYQGYIAKSYTYFSTDSYSNKLSRNRWKILLTEGLLWATFAAINLLIPILFISRGKQFVNWDIKHNFPYRAGATMITIFNFLYTLVTFCTLLQHNTPGYPNVLDCFITANRHRCSIPRKAIFYEVSIGILITKVIILPAALLVELITVVYVTKRVSRSELLPYTSVQRTNTTCSFFTKVFMLWQVLIFTQIMVGSASIPFLIFLLVSPIQSILLAVELIALIVSIAGCLLGIPLPTRCKFNAHSCVKSYFLYVQTLLIMVVIFLTSSTYCIIVKEGISMGSVKGYVMSLIPTIPISIIIWMIQERIRRKRGKKKQGKGRELMTVLVRRKESFSTEEEMMHLSTNSEDSEDDIYLQ